MRVQYDLKDLRERAVLLEADDPLRMETGESVIMWEEIILKPC